MPHSPKPETIEVQTAQAVDPAAICSIFQQALDDGQEIKMHRFWSPAEQRNEYHVRIYGDCAIEAERVDLAAAINAAAAQYRLWVEADEDE